MSVLSGCLLEPATGFAGSSTIMVSSLGFVCTFAASDNQSSSVYCSNVLDDRAVVDSTALMGHGGGCMTCLTAACLAASFHILPDMVFSDCILANESITSVMHSEVSLAFWLSQWRTFSSSSVPSFHSGQVVGALNCIQPSLLFGNLRMNFDCAALIKDGTGTPQILDTGASVRVPIFPIVVCVRSAYVIGAGVGFRVESGAMVLLQLDL